MKKKFSRLRILGIALVVVLLVSLIAVAVPVSAATQDGDERSPGSLLPIALVVIAAVSVFPLALSRMAEKWSQHRAGRLTAFFARYLWTKGRLYYLKFPILALAAICLIVAVSIVGLTGLPPPILLLGLVAMLVLVALVIDTMKRYYTGITRNNVDLISDAQTSSGSDYALLHPTGARQLSTSVT